MPTIGTWNRLLLDSVMGLYRILWLGNFSSERILFGFGQPKQRTLS